jgi:glucose/arabinose dehydrogenase
MICTFENYSIEVTSQVYDQKESSKGTKLDDLDTNNNSTFERSNDNIAESDQKEILYSDKFEVINKTANSATLYLERFDSPIKIMQTGPTIKDTHLSIETVFKGIKEITNIAFLANNDILYLEQREGTVNRIINGNVIPEPLITVNVNGSHGLVGITVSTNEKANPFVFLFFTETLAKNDVNASEGKFSFADRVYKYELVNNKLVNPKVLLNLPAFPGPDHHGGEILIGPDSNLYVATGDIDGFRNDSTRTMAQNYVNGSYPDGRAGILRISQIGGLVENGILGDTYPLNSYYAYGIRNSFGMDFDPVTGNLWNTENGPEYGDEINFVPPGFNSGYQTINGKYLGSTDSGEFVDFGGKGKYSNPEFSWGIKGDNFTVAPTGIVFLNSTKLGKQYESDMFVSDAKYGNIYHFDLNANRTQLILNGTLSDQVADNLEELDKITFGKGFSGITDLQVGPDGYLYVLAHIADEGAILKIAPKK